MKYRRVPGKVLHYGTREVIVKDDGAYLYCPCGERKLFASSTVHTIEFDKHGVLTLDPSCGYAKNSEHPANWCHFWLRAGVPEMVSDAQCPGSSRKEKA